MLEELDSFDKRFLDIDTGIDKDLLRLPAGIDDDKLGSW